MDTIIKNNDIILYISIFVTFLVFTLLVLVLKYKEQLNKLKTSIDESKDKIKYLRQINAENEHRHNTFTHETEKNIMTLEHSIESLKLKVKEGTKNQVVAMLEAQQNKRSKQLERAGLKG